jgi:alkanesulfonate monooxygenase SsuD/methylene tetrahydromethanopterin reductase-like flavin-dependent oxidoreductase (luciferase family)
MRHRRPFGSAQYTRSHGGDVLDAGRTAPVGCSAVKVGISLRGHFPISQAGLDLFMAYAAQLPPGSMYDVPAGDFDTRTQARNLIEVARAARESGLDMLLIGDHHAMPVTNFFQPTPTLGRLLAETGDMPVGILYLAPFLHPVLLAEQVGTLAAFAPEPLTLVLSIGAREGAFRAFGMTEKSRVSRTEEAVPLVRRLLAGETVDHQGRHFRLEGARVNPLPRVPTPIWIGGRMGAAVERAGRLGDGWLTGTTSNDAELSAELERYRKAASEAGRPRVAVLRRDVHVGRDDDDARSAVAPILERGYRRATLGWDELLVGGPARVAARLRRYEEMGFGTALLRPIVGDHAAMLDSLRRLGGDVLPRLRAP